MKSLVKLQNINGMGFLDFSIEPHFNIDNVEVLEDLRKYSRDIKIYALEDSAYIIIENNQLSFYGDIYLIENGNIIKIN